MVLENYIEILIPEILILLKMTKGHLFHLEIQRAEDFPTGIEYHVAECSASPTDAFDQKIQLFSDFQCAQAGFKGIDLIGRPTRNF